MGRFGPPGVVDSTHRGTAAARPSRGRAADSGRALLTTLPDRRPRRPFSDLRTCCPNVPVPTHGDPGAVSINIPLDNGYRVPDDEVWYVLEATADGGLITGDFNEKELGRGDISGKNYNAFVTEENKKYELNTLQVV